MFAPVGDLFRSAPHEGLQRVLAFARERTSDQAYVGQLHSALDSRVAGQDLFHQRGAGAGQANDEDRVRCAMA